MSEPPTLAKGDRVKITWLNIENHGQVAFVSSNGWSIAIEIDRCRDGLNGVALLWDEDTGTFRSIVSQVSVQVEKVLHA